VKVKVVLGVLAVTGILALSSTAAHAGDGGKPSVLTSFFVCHAINGANVGREVDVYSDEVGAVSSPNPAPFGATRTLVTIGQAVLACAQALVFPAGANPPVPNGPPVGNEIIPQIPSGATGFELKCYTASTNKKSGEVGLFNAEDALFGGTELGIPAARDIRLICGPAAFSQ
jgi:hypothetical protein